DDLSSHVLMAAATEYIAGKRKLPGLLRNEVDASGFPRFDIGPDPQFVEMESVLTVQRGEFQHDRYALLEHDLRRGVRKLLGSDGDHLILLSRGLRCARRTLS